MGISKYPSIVSMQPIDGPLPSILDFLADRFPRVPRTTWEARICDGKVTTEDGTAITTDYAYSPGARLFYFKETAAEPTIPFAEEVLFQNDDLLVACKPHFLPVIPAGPYINETLLTRLRTATGNDDLTPAHRIDRLTAGLLLFSTRPETRSAYVQLFAQGKVTKTYDALAACPEVPEQRTWTVENRLETGDPWFRMAAVVGEPNAQSTIELIRVGAGIGTFRLNPLTGKKHQLRLHMAEIGYPILNDPFYPELQPEQPDDFNRPLQLIARKLQFIDPLTKQQMAFTSSRPLATDAEWHQ